MLLFTRVCSACACACKCTLHICNCTRHTQTLRAPTRTATLYIHSILYIMGAKAACDCLSSLCPRLRPLPSISQVNLICGACLLEAVSANKMQLLTLSQ
jgi:hypothetical protein